MARSRTTAWRPATFLGSFAVLALALTPCASGQTALAPWFDADGFYNRPNVDIARATNDMAACRIEALRLKGVRNTRSVGSASAFNADGSYNPGVSAAATGIASIVFAIQDARYNGSIEQVEFRDCAVSLGYQHYRLSRERRSQFDGQSDRGFAALVSAQTPADGRLNSSERNNNYYAAGLVERAYQNPTVPPIVAATEQPTVAATEQPTVDATPVEEASLAPVALSSVQENTGPTVIEPIGEGQTAAPQEGMAIVVASARQRSALQSLANEIRFTRVTPEGQFIDLLQPSVSFSMRSRRNAHYSTYQIPAGRYVLSGFGMLNTCLGTLTFEVAAGDVAYLGEWVFQPPGPPLGLLNPLANINSTLDNSLKSDLRVAIGDDLDAAREAMQAEPEAKARLTRVTFQNGYRVPCTGSYIGRVANPDWPEFDPSQANHVHDAMAAAIIETIQPTSP